jgi:hypothetical protein
MPLWPIGSSRIPGRLAESGGRYEGNEPATIHVRLRAARISRFRQDGKAGLQAKKKCICLVFSRLSFRLAGAENTFDNFESEKVTRPNDMAAARRLRCACLLERAGVNSPGSRFFGGEMADKKTTRTKDPARKLADLLAAVEQQFGKDIKCSVGDYIRLLQAQQDFDRDTPRNIEVTWIDSLEEKSGLEK